MTRQQRTRDEPLPGAVDRLSAGLSEDAVIEKQEIAGRQFDEVSFRHGLSRKDDSLPEKLTKVPMPKGPCTGETIRIGEMLEAYYRSRGWDPKTGIPSEEKLKELGLLDRATPDR